MENQSNRSPSDPPHGIYHVPVLLQESVNGLNVRKDGIYVDCTFGGGGHSKEILKRLDDRGKLYAFDQDKEVMRNLPEDQRLTFLPHNFRHLKRFLRLQKVLRVDGILADLGVSSHQFDERERGFSIRFDADLDMRMDKRQALTADQVVMTYSEKDLHKVFEQLGEVPNARNLAKTLVQWRQHAPIRSIANFKHAVHSAVKGNPNKWLAQVFQALRIAVNDELGALREMLQQVPDLLNESGRVAIITFHSLEDRMVKNFFRNSLVEEEEGKPDQGKSTNPFRLITKKPIVPTMSEIKQNPRSRSAKLRIAEKL
jgi:16S rRNA (cytosine1402-N4)-methyltransferase